jgi:hypothetical protein
VGFIASIGAQLEIVSFNHGIALSPGGNNPQNPILPLKYVRFRDQRREGALVLNSSAAPDTYQDCLKSGIFSIERERDSSIRHSKREASRLARKERLWRPLVISLSCQEIPIKTMLSHCRGESVERSAPKAGTPSQDSGTSAQERCWPGQSPQPLSFEISEPEYSWVRSQLPELGTIVKDLTVCVPVAIPTSPL